MPSAVTHRGQLADPDVEAPERQRTANPKKMELVPATITSNRYI